MQSNEPYIGSVRFFKNIIFLCCILGVLIPTGLALRWRSRAKTAESLLAQNAVAPTVAEVKPLEKVPEKPKTTLLAEGSALTGDLTASTIAVMEGALMEGRFKIAKK